MPPAASIISGTQWPPAKIGSSHSSAATRGAAAAEAATRSRTASIRASSSARSADPALGPAGGGAEPLGVGEDLDERRGIEREHLRAARAAARRP